ncbi:MAG: tripartite tricarboxylate transporter substrate binding protein [Variovorax sp.]|nr:tripartite tricarboxylate transporter substrate binding protein [Variovorax sp.]
MKQTRRQALTVALSLAAATGAGPLWAQAFPSKPITIVVAYPAGGDSDVLARLYAEKLSTRIGQPVVIDNKPGASGVIGATQVSKAPADGYTLLFAPATFSIAQLVLKTGSAAGYDVLHGFTPIIQTGTLPMALVASTASGLKSFKDVVAASKTRELAYASPGSGSSMHILGEMVNRAAGIKLNHVPYKGVAPAINDVLGGHVPLTYITLGPVDPYLASGKLTVLAVAERQRSPLAPNVPTFQELGLKDVESTAWHGLFGPKGMPADVVKTLNAHLNEIIKMPDVVAKMATFGSLPLGGPPETLAKTNASDFERFGRIIKELGIQAD